MVGDVECTNILFDYIWTQMNPNELNTNWNSEFKSSQAVRLHFESTVLTFNIECGHFASYIFNNWILMVHFYRSLIDPNFWFRLPPISVRKKWSKVHSHVKRSPSNSLLDKSSYPRLFLISWIRYRWWALRDRLNGFVCKRFMVWQKRD